MTFDPDIHHHRPIRLREYDYAQAGAYFVTVCTQGRACLFGDVVDGEMRLNEAGRMVQTIWDELADRFPSMECDAFVIMPNHVHGIIVLTDYDNAVGAGPCACPCLGPRACPQSNGQPRGGCPYDQIIVIAGYCASVQINYHHLLSVWCNGLRVAGFPWTYMATQLLRTHYSQRPWIERHSGIYHEQPGALGG